MHLLSIRFGEELASLQPWAWADLVGSIGATAARAAAHRDSPELAGPLVRHLAKHALALAAFLGATTIDGARRRIWELHCSKSADYGTDEDPLANIRASESWGIPAWPGAMVRACDKVHRLERWALSGVLRNESALDSALDLCSYCIIAYIILQEPDYGYVETHGCAEDEDDCCSGSGHDACPHHAAAVGPDAGTGPRAA